jgi:filamentous hemagglutinin
MICCSVKRFFMFVFSPKTNFTRLRLALFAGDGNQMFISTPTPFRVSVSGAITHPYGGATGIEFCIGTLGPLTVGVQPWGHSTQVTEPLK